MAAPVRPANATGGGRARRTLRVRDGAGSLCRTSHQTGSPTVTATPPTRIDQLAIAVEDLDEALAFWERAFGLTPEYREVVESDGVE